MANTWFYFDSFNEKQGPVDSADLRALAIQGTITPETILEAQTGQQRPARVVKGLVFGISRQPAAENGMQDSITSRHPATPNNKRGHYPDSDSPAASHHIGIISGIGDEMDCPYCAEKIKTKAVVCKHCGNKMGTQIQPGQVRAESAGGAVNVSGKMDEDEDGEDDGLVCSICHSYVPMGARVCTGCHAKVRYGFQGGRRCGCAIVIAFILAFFFGSFHFVIPTVICVALGIIILVFAVIKEKIEKGTVTFYEIDAQE